MAWLKSFESSVIFWTGREDTRQKRTTRILDWRKRCSKDEKLTWVRDWHSDFIIREWQRPKSRSTNTEATRLSFSENSCRQLPILNVIDAYNQNMNDLYYFDEIRAAFDAQLCGRGNWFSIYQFVLEFALVNTVDVTRMQHWSLPSTTAAQIRLQLSQNMLQEARTLMYWESVDRVQPLFVAAHQQYFTKNIVLQPNQRFEKVLLGQVHKKKRRISINVGTKNFTTTLCSDRIVLLLFLIEKFRYALQKPWIVSWNTMESRLLPTHSLPHR